MPTSIHSLTSCLARKLEKIVLLFSEKKKPTIFADHFANNDNHNHISTRIHTNHQNRSSMAAFCIMTIAGKKTPSSFGFMHPQWSQATCAHRVARSLAKKPFDRLIDNNNNNKKKWNYFVCLDLKTIQFNGPLEWGCLFTFVPKLNVFREFNAQF